MHYEHQGGVFVPTLRATGAPWVAAAKMRQGSATQARAMSHNAFRAALVWTAARLGCHEKEVGRLLDPRHPSKLPRLRQALAQLGKRLVVEMQAA
ncbi:MAG: hypothetical protein ACHQ9S_04665 [Candidatus Binatia bacterium]